MPRFSCFLPALALLVIPLAQAAPAPFPKTSHEAPPTLAKLQQRLKDRGIVVEKIERGTSPGEWSVRLSLQSVSNGVVVRRQLVKQATGPDERAVLEALLKEGRDANQLMAEDLQRRRAVFEFQMRLLR